MSFILNSGTLVCGLTCSAGHSFVCTARPSKGSKSPPTPAPAASEIVEFAEPSLKI